MRFKTDLLCYGPGCSRNREHVAHGRHQVVGMDPVGTHAVERGRSQDVGMDVVGTACARAWTHQNADMDIVGTEHGRKRM